MTSVLVLAAPMGSIHRKVWSMFKTLFSLKFDAAWFKDEWDHHGCPTATPSNDSPKPRLLYG